MRAVVLIILLVVIVLLAISLIPDSVMNSTQNKELIPIKGKKDVIVEENQINENIIKKNEEEKQQKEIEKSKEQITENKEEFPEIEKGKIITNISSWRLAGQQKNILLIDLLIKNGLETPMKNKDKEITCTLLNKDNIILGTISNTININVKEENVLNLKDISFGFVDIETDSVSCDVKDYIKPNNINTEIKPLSELKTKLTIIKNENNTKGGFLLEDNSVLKENQKEEIPLPSLN